MIRRADSGKIPRSSEFFLKYIKELENPKYFCENCGNKLYNTGMLTLERDQTGSTGGMEPKTGYYMCNERSCSLRYIEFDKYSLQNAKAIEELNEKISKIIKILAKRDLWKD